METKTPQQIKSEQIKVRQELLRQRQIQIQKQKIKLAEKTMPRPVPIKSTPPPKLAQNSATKINVTPWLEQYNKTAYVIGGGPSLTGFNWKLLNDKFIIGINRAYEVLPNAQVIYFTDDDWYSQHKEMLIKHTGIKIKGSLTPNKLGQDTNIYQFHLTGATGIDVNPGCLKHGSNSTYAVLNMLYQWGFKNIYLLGIDLKWKIVSENGNKGNKKTHWHSGHKRIDGEALYSRLKNNFEQLLPFLKQYDITIINVNNDTNLTVFPIKTYEEIFGSDSFPTNTQ
jgi:hypothetical protein